jgi:predicted type IV restriction endonuclease
MSLRQLGLSGSGLRRPDRACSGRECIVEARLDLANTIDVVRQRIEQSRQRTITIGEENTKATLIDPILTALGWNLENIDEVRHEYKRRPQDNPVDYALFQSATACLLIEAKSLEQDLNDDKWVSQNVAYAAVVGVEWCVLTNGDEWRIYNSHAVVPVDQKLFRTVRISDTQNEGQVLWALELLSQEEMRGRLIDEHWKKYFIDRNVGRGLRTIIGLQDRTLIRLIQKRTKGLKPSDIRSALKRAKIAHTEERITIEFPVPTTPAKAAQASSNARERSTIEHDVPKLGKVFKATYKGKPYTMKVVKGEDGGVAYQVGNDVFKNPSAAGSFVTGGAINGWKFWGIEQQS